jgi:hypothetical protein
LAVGEPHHHRNGRWCAILQDPHPAVWSAFLSLARSKDGRLEIPRLWSRLYSVPGLLDGGEYRRRHWKINALVTCAMISAVAVIPAATKLRMLVDRTAVGDYALHNLEP